MTVRCSDGELLIPYKTYLVNVPQQFLEVELFKKYHGQLLRCDDIDLRDKSLIHKKDSVRIPAQWLSRVKTDLYTNEALSKFAHHISLQATIDALPNDGPAQQEDKVVEGFILGVGLTLAAVLLTFFLFKSSYEPQPERFNSHNSYNSQHF